MATATAQVQSGVVLTFDMHCETENAAMWTNPVFYGGKSILDLLDDYGARATFVVSDFKVAYASDDWCNLLARIGDKHEIGGHTLNHGVWQPGSDPYAYWRTEVFPNYEWYLKLRAKLGANWPWALRSFAFPNDVAGADIASLLLQAFKHLRGVLDPNAFGPLTYDQVSQDGTLQGGFLDRATFLPPFGAWWSATWPKWLDEASRENKFVVFASHVPSWWEIDPAKPLWADPTKTLEFLNYVKFNTNLQYVTMGDLPSIYPRAVQEEDVNLKRDMEALRNLVAVPT